MGKWYTVSGRFSEEEKALIEKWQKNTGISDNQMVRGGVAIMLGMMSMAEVLVRPDLAALRGYAKEVSKIVRSRGYEKKMQQVFELWAKIYKEGQIKDLDSKLQQIANDLKVFDSHPKRGRKSEKQKSTESESSQ